MPARASRPPPWRREYEFAVVSIVFVNADGTRLNVEAADGTRLLEIAQGAGLPLEGTCEGQMACSTCHVIVASEWFAKLPPASMDEEDMLDLAAGVCRTSRLSCQIELTPEMDGLEVRIPGVSRDMQID
jgi:ferredoxin-2, mitochondrial